MDHSGISNAPKYPDVQPDDVIASDCDVSK